MPSNHLILCCPLLLLPSVFPSIGVFSSESVVHIFGQSIGVPASTSVLPMNIQDWFPLEFTGWISLLSKGLSRVFSNTTAWHSAFFVVQLSHPYMTTGKTIALTRWTFVGKIMSLLFNLLSRLVITFLPWSKHLLIQFSSVTQLCPALCDPMDWSTQGFPVHHQLPKLAQTHVHQVSDAIQPSCPLSSLAPPAFNLSQHQGLFQWVCYSYQVAKVLEFQLQCQSFQWIFRTDFL